MIKLLPVICAALSLAGCTTFSQNKDEVLIRDPAIGQYGEPTDATPLAKRQWIYAAMSDHVYDAARLRSFIDRGKPLPSASQSPLVESCKKQAAPAIPSEWQRWPDFPSITLDEAMRKKGLFLLVFERETSPREIVVVFEGTNFSEIPDWISNFRWLLRFVPMYSDQYTLTAKEVGHEFFDYLRKRPGKYRVDENDATLHSANGEAIKITATGHSLGGGLAQHFAYSFKQATPDSRGPKVSEVFAFDTSPVTGWFSVDDPPRTHNAAGLVIHRIFEHGEILAYLRLLTSRMVGGAENPAKWEYRYNFDRRVSLMSLINNHSIRSLACGLAEAAGESE